RKKKSRRLSRWMPPGQILPLYRMRRSWPRCNAEPKQNLRMRTSNSAWKTYASIYLGKPNTDHFCDSCSRASVRLIKAAAAGQVDRPVTKSLQGRHARSRGGGCASTAASSLYERSRSTDLADERRGIDGGNAPAG